MSSRVIAPSERPLIWLVRLLGVLYGILLVIFGSFFVVGFLYETFINPKGINLPPGYTSAFSYYLDYVPGGVVTFTKGILFLIPYGRIKNPQTLLLFYRIFVGSIVVFVLLYWAAFVSPGGLPFLALEIGTAYTINLLYKERSLNQK